MGLRTPTHRSHLDMLRYHQHTGHRRHCPPLHSDIRSNSQDQSGRSGLNTVNRRWCLPAKRRALGVVRKYKQRRPAQDSLLSQASTPINMPLCASTGPVLLRCCQHRTSTGPVLATNGMFKLYCVYMNLAAHAIPIACGTSFH